MSSLKYTLRFSGDAILLSNDEPLSREEALVLSEALHRYVFAADMFTRYDQFTQWAANASTAPVSAVRDEDEDDAEDDESEESTDWDQYSLFKDSRQARIDAAQEWLDPEEFRRMKETMQRLTTTGKP
jgi:hypothetical protein